MPAEPDSENAMPDSISFQYLIDPNDVREALADFVNQPVIGLDTETFFERDSGQNRLSLLQLASPTGRVVVIDGLAAGIESARSLIEDPNALMAAHNARFDEGVLIRNGFDAKGFVDTLKLSRRTLTLHSHSLASVAGHLFGLSLDKQFQMSDWQRRPLSREQLRYAAMDAVVALDLYRELAARLESEGRWPAELRRAMLKPPPLEGDELPVKRRRKPAIDLRPLTSEERRLAEKLAAWREQEATRERLPLYMICHDKTLDHLAIVRPRSIEALSTIYGLGPTRIAKYGAELLQILG